MDNEITIRIDGGSVVSVYYNGNVIKIQYYVVGPGLYRTTYCQKTGRILKEEFTDDTGDDDDFITEVNYNEDSSRVFTILCDYHDTEIMVETDEDCNVLNEEHKKWESFIKNR